MQVDVTTKPKSQPLTKEQVAVIIGLAKQGKTMAQIADELGVSKHQVNRVIREYKKLCKERGVDPGIPKHVPTAMRKGEIKEAVTEIVDGKMNIDEILSKWGL